MQAFVARYLRQPVDDTDSWTQGKLDRFVELTLDFLKKEAPPGESDLSRRAEDEWM